MPACRIKSLRLKNLAPQEALRHPGYFEWREVEVVPGAPLETSGCQNLRLECINCGWTVQGAVPPAVNGITVCPDCGDDLFHVTRLFERCTEPLPEFVIRRTKAGYIHIDGWQHLKGAAVYYTCNGQDPSAVDSRFTRPFKPDFDEDAEIRAVCYWGESKSQMASLTVPGARPAVSYPCRFCKTQVTGRGDVIACPTCGAVRRLLGNGQYSEDEAPQGFVCSSCDAPRLERGKGNRLRCGNCGAEYRFSGKWLFNGWRIACPVCRQSFFMQRLNSSDRTCTCRSCRSVLAFDAQYRCWRALSPPPPPPPPPQMREQPSYVHPVPIEPKKPAPPKEKEDSSGCGCLILIAIIIFVLVCMCE